MPTLPRGPQNPTEMKICRNCRTINDDRATACVRCKMRDQLVDYNPEVTKEWRNSMLDKNNVKPLYNVCKNCGTPDHGNSATCAKCRFPLSVKRRAADDDGRTMTR